MPRRLFIVLITSLASFAASGVSAEEKTPGPQLGGRLQRFREETRAIPSPEYLIYQRSNERAQQRAARLEAYRWMGYSPNRPVMSSPAFANDMNFPYYLPWVAAYRTGHFHTW